MNEKLVSTLKNFFNFNKNQSINELALLPEVKAIGGLVTLLKSIDEAGTSPKIIAQNLEDVIVRIYLQTPPSELEKELLTILEKVQAEQSREELPHFYPK